MSYLSAVTISDRPRFPLWDALAFPYQETDSDLSDTSSLLWRGGMTTIHKINLTGFSEVSTKNSFDPMMR